MSSNPSDISFNVYKVEYVGTPNHQAIYVETNPTASQTRGGNLYHVSGNLLHGMKYEIKTSYNLECSKIYIPRLTRKIGIIAQADLPRFVAECCEEVRPPPAQLSPDKKRLGLNHAFYRCGQWLEDVVDLAFAKGIFKNPQTDPEESPTEETSLAGNVLLESRNRSHVQLHRRRRSHSL
ncbi:hypothetical protein MYU51_018409 [Penicillium brevicompactum]